MTSLVSLLSIAASIVVADDCSNITFSEAVESKSLDVHFPVDSKIIDTSAAHCVVTLVKNHTYASSIDKPYKGEFSPPFCYDDPDYSLVYLRYKANVDPGQQFDRIAGVWIGNHAVLRTTAQEPNKELGPHWEIFREISQYRALFGKNGTVTASLDNVVNDEYTSSFYVTITAEFYKKDPSQYVVQRVPYAPDQIVPIFKSNGNHPWFNVQPNTLGKNYNLVTFPKNLDGLYLELFTSHHGCDEFQYSNPPDELKGRVRANCGGGSFREVQILLDDEIVGAVWPLPLIYTGGLLPALWHPIVSIGAFEAPTYIIDLTPYVAKVLDGKPHNVSFAVDHGLDHWPTNANLLVYQDHNVEETAATLDRKVFDRNVAPNVVISGSGFYYTVRTNVTRQVNVESTITNSQGIRKYNIKKKFNFVNRQEYSANGQSFRLRSTTQTKTTIDFKDGTKTTKYTEDYPLYGASWQRRNKAKANARVEHDLRQKLRIDGNKDHFRVGVEGYELTITQKAKAQSNSRTGITSSNEVVLAASNSTGCYSRDVSAVTGKYTKYVEAKKCPNVNQYVDDYNDDDDDHGQDLPYTPE
ncbi:hypothetical protein H257_13253 [Aphanomyces astaci]|uniref:Peptide N-acetyl-beta-D-glucosaminyl asparaginase amidase A N-terminal domain-containing protein n=1 Tax=Aphanomyces astaci TaxID=112090 RepID=W4FX24_APHAT|nr:hypothetical protein H257_13253 [Aphanomyces astaci]ETV71354.1 hypothetical protein H257_13253 [Aphanomyces astaci]|eukprot:XP_009839019.1 hypothetical protein H257_13253 [Aphanomyces astaci]